MTSYTATSPVARERLLTVSFALESEASLRGVPFFRFKRSTVVLPYEWQAFVVNVPVLDAVRESISARLRRHQRHVDENVRPLPDYTSSVR